MSIIDDASKLAQSFLTLDDVVLGQNLVEGGLSQLSKVGASSSGPSVVLNVAARAFCLGTQVSSRSAEKAADSVKKVFPMAKETKAIAGKMGDRAKALGQQCSNLASHGVELAGGLKARNPITKHRWLEKQAPNGYSAGKLAADTTFGTMQSLAMMPLFMGIDLVRSSNGGKLGSSLSKAVDGAFKSGNGSLSKDASMQLREGLISLAMGAGVPVMQSSLALIEAVARLALSDPRALHCAMDEGMDQVRLLADAKLEEGRKGVSVSVQLRKFAKLVADNHPEAFMTALECDEDGQTPKLARILAAMVKDNRKVVIFFTVYPQVLGLLSSDLSVLLANSLADLSGGSSKIKKDSLEGSAVFTLLDTVVGSSQGKPLFPESTVFLAQDLSFTACSELLGSSAAIERVERLYGKVVAERLANDVSLNASIMGEGESRDRDKHLRGMIKATDEPALSRQIDLCSARLAQLESWEASESLMSGQLSLRVEVLRAFNSLAATELGLRGLTKPVNQQEFNTFLDWATSA